MAETIDPLVVKNVEEQLLSEKKSKRKPGEVVYPLEYSSDMVDLDNWDHMFLHGCCGNITMHQFATPPATILDLGCGGGLWSIEAAKQWPEATVIGFDLKNVQPRSAVLEAHANLAHRVKWVHGNLLDGLPFESSHFDFVRVAGIGLGVPEDEWQSVLEEISRVLKPGAPLEIIEEDLIFPCGRPPKPRLSPLSVDHNSMFMDTDARSSITSGSQSTRSSKTLASDPWSSTSENSERTLSSATTSIQEWTASQYASFTPPTPSKLKPPLPPPDPRDHTRLKASWEAMLAGRFLPQQLLAVLPFYLSSTFVNIQTHPSLQVVLPPNSHSPKRDGIPRGTNGKSKWLDSTDTDIFFEHSLGARKSLSDMKNDNASRSLNSPSIKESQHPVPLWPHMHLAKTFQTVSACKEALWIEYEKIYADRRGIPPVTRTPRPKETPKDIDDLMSDAKRDEFEEVWSNWRNDMMDRISMRNSVQSEFFWGEPEGGRPDWRIWRHNQFARHLPDRTPPALAGLSEICRTRKGFVAWKPS